MSLSTAGYKDILASIWRNVREGIDELEGRGIASPIFINFDNHGNIHELPNQDLVGPGGFTLSTEQGLVRGFFSLGVGTVNDDGMFRHIDMIDFFFRRYSPQARIPVYDLETSQELGVLIVKEMDALPVLRTEVRGLQYIQVALASDLSVQH